MKHISSFEDYSINQIKEDYSISQIKDAFEKATSKIHLAKLLGIPTNVNGRTLNKRLQEFADKINFNLDSLVKGTDAYKERVYYSKPKYCKYCSKVIPYEKRNNEFCSLSCKTSYQNKERGEWSDDVKSKISRTLLKKTGYWSDEDVEKIQNHEYDSRKHFHKVCPVCHGEFVGKKDQIFCSKECVHKSDEVREKLREKQKELVRAGKHTGWTVRTKNTYSYAEKYWMNVLDNRNISYIREDHTNGKYFLDFLIEKNGKWIDLEIDGKQHKEPDRVIHDKERDDFLKSNDYIVYRVEWNSVNTKNGKQKMDEKINDFFEFYNKI